MRMRKQKMWIERSKRTINDANFNKKRAKWAQKKGSRFKQKFYRIRCHLCRRSNKFRRESVKTINAMTDERSISIGCAARMPKMAIGKQFIRRWWLLCYAIVAWMFAFRWRWLTVSVWLSCVHARWREWENCVLNGSDKMEWNLNCDDEFSSICIARARANANQSKRKQHLCERIDAECSPSSSSSPPSFEHEMK